MNLPNGRTLFFIFCVIFCFFIYKSKNVCRSHDSFVFHCRHNDSNTDIYLRRTIANNDKIIKQRDMTPEEIVREEIEETIVRPKMIVSCILEQLQLLRLGKLQTGFWAGIIPVIFLHYDNRSFDHYTDVIVAFLTETQNYTKEEADLLRNTLLERTLPSSVIESCGLSLIQSNLSNIIQDRIMQAIISENNYVIPSNLQSLVYSWGNKITYDPSRKKSIMNAISDGRIKDLDELEKFIDSDNIFISNIIDAKKYIHQY